MSRAAPGSMLCLLLACLVPRGWSAAPEDPWPPPFDRAFRCLEPDDQDPPVDLIHWRLFRNETRRWLREGGVPTEDSFEVWAFGGEGGEDRLHEQLNAFLESKLRRLDRVLRLSPGDRRKLMLAGRGDVARVLERVDESRRSFARALADSKRLAELQQSLAAVDRRVGAGLFDGSSLLVKTLRRVADARSPRPPRDRPSN